MQQHMSTQTDVHHTTFLGIKTLQTWPDLALWERFFNEHPELCSMIEIGTYRGGLSTFLLLQAKQRGKWFFTFDAEQQPDVQGPVPAELGLAGQALTEDVFASQSLQLMLAPEATAMHPLLLLCDGGDKARELQTFAPLLQPGDYIAVHDWGTEVGPMDVRALAHILEPVPVPHNSLTRIWRRVEQRIPEPEHTGWGRIAVGVRVSKHPEFMFFVDWSALLTGGLRKGDSVLMPKGHAPAHTAANDLARDFLRGPWDSLLLVDDDMTFPPDALHKLRDNQANWDYDVVFAFCTHRVWPPKPVVMRRWAEQPGEPQCRRGEYFDILTDFQDGDIVPVDAVGLAFTLMRRPVLEAMVDRDNLDFSFPFSYGPGKESDDIPFSRRARALGFRLAVDTSVKIGHIAHMPFGWTQFQSWLAEEQKAQQAQQPHVDLDGADLIPILEEALPHLDGGRVRAQELLEAIRGSA